MVDTSKMTALWVWYLVEPQAPRLVGAVSLTPALNRCSFRYDAMIPIGQRTALLCPPTCLSVPSRSCRRQRSVFPAHWMTPCRTAGDKMQSGLSTVHHG